MKQNSIIPILIIALLSFWLGSRCASDVEFETVTETVTDTTFVTHVDTVFVQVTDTTRVRIAVPEPVQLPGRPDVNRYEQSVTDSLISGIMKAEVRGELLDWSFDYIALFPRYITRTDTIRIRDERTVTRTMRPPNAIAAGVFAGYGHEAGIGFEIGYRQSARRHWTYRYDLSTQSHQIGVSIPIINF